MIRDCKQYVLCTFLPTFLLWLLSYFSLLIQIDDFTNRFMGSVTALLVFTALLGPIYDQLPETSYLKFIDVHIFHYLVSYRHKLFVLTEQHNSSTELNITQQLNESFEINSFHAHGAQQLIADL